MVVALSFDFLNGFHDAANSIATVVSTRVLSPRVAVLWAAFFNFVAAFTFGTAVARTMGKGMIRLEAVNLYVILAGLLGAIFWDILTWYYGLPVSSSHALMGGYAGAAIAKAGWGVILLSGWTKVLAFIILSPAIGFILGGALMLAVYWIFQSWSPQRLDKYFRKLQLLSAAAYSFGHGTNDAQKTMGIIAGTLFTAGILKQVLHSLLGGADGIRRHRPGNHGGWLAHRENHGHEDHAAEAGGRLLRGNGGGHQPAGHRHGRHPRLHHPHHRRRHHGRGQRAALQRRPLGSGAQHHVGLGFDHPHLRRRLLPVLPADSPILPRRLRTRRGTAYRPRLRVAAE